MRQFTYRIEDSAHYAPGLAPRTTLYVAMNEKGEDVKSSPIAQVIQEYCRQHNQRLAQEDAMERSKILRVD